jgi:hypothetical protein
MVNVTKSAVRRPEGQRKGRNGMEDMILPPDTKPFPENSLYPTLEEPGPFPPYKFAFWSVVGAAKGPFVTFNKGATFTTGTTDVVAKAWYVLDNPQPPSGTGVFVDAFLMDIGKFVDDDFVTVKDANNQVEDKQRTDDANVNGLMPTPSTASVDALAKLAGASLYWWVCVSGKEQIFAEVLTAQQETTADAIAFYKTDPAPPSPVREIRGRFEDRAWVSWGVTVDGGGPWGGGGPIPPGDPLVLQFAAGLALAEAAQKLHPTLQGEALGIAARQVSLAGEAISRAIASASEQREQ